MRRVEFKIVGVPKPGGSKKGFVNPKTKRVIIVEDCKKNADWRSDVKNAALRAGIEPMEGALAVHVAFYMPRPKGHLNSKGQVKASAPPFPITKPDATKLWRSTEDALTGIAWRDDAQVVAQNVTKHYQAVDKPPGATIWIAQVTA